MWNWNSAFFQIFFGHTPIAIPIVCKVEQLWSSKLALSILNRLLPSKFAFDVVATESHSPFIIPTRLDHPRHYHVKVTVLAEGVTMDFTDKLAVLVPPPSQDPSTYKPFPEEVERIVDEILSEEASLESSRDDDCNLTSTSNSDESSSGMLSSTIAGPSSQKGKNPLRPFNSSTAASTSKTRKQTNSSSQRRSRAARRTITVVNMESDSEDEDVSSKGGDDPAEENGVTSAMEYNDDVDSNAATLANVPTIPTPTQPEIADSQDDQMSMIDGDNAEENVIFSSVSESAQLELLTFIGSHQFMLESAQPVKKSARRQFTGEVREKAQSAGMPDEAIYGLIHYIRRLYLEFAGVEAVKLLDFADDIPFGLEIDDEVEDASSKGKRKRSSKGLDKGEEKVKKRKKSKKRISKELDVSVQPLVEAETLNENLSTGIVMQSPVKPEQSGVNTLPQHDEESDGGPEGIPESPVLTPAVPAQEDHQTDDAPDIIDLTLSDNEEPDTSDLHDRCSTCYGTSPEPDFLDHLMKLDTPAAGGKGKDDDTSDKNEAGPVISQQHDSQHGAENEEVPEPPLASPLKSSVETSKAAIAERESEVLQSKSEIERVETSKAAIAERGSEVLQSKFEIEPVQTPSPRPAEKKGPPKKLQPEASSPQTRRVEIPPSSAPQLNTVQNKKSPSKAARTEPSSSQPPPRPSFSVETVQTTQSESITQIQKRHSKEAQPKASSPQPPNLEPTQHSHPRNSAQAERNPPQSSLRPSSSLEPVQSPQSGTTTKGQKRRSQKDQAEASPSQLPHLGPAQNSQPESIQMRLKSPLQDPSPQLDTDAQSNAESVNGSSRDSIAFDKKTAKNKRRRSNRRRNRIKRKSEVPVESTERSAMPPQSPAGIELPATPVSQNSKGNSRHYLHGALSPNPQEWDVDF
ncbi:hypothetical protein N7488_003032 [Penicillium malachiteum]|nr:hypothetical protein N7488_003032 [Penicillium malachiteum]